MGADASFFFFGAPGPKIERVARALAGGETDLVPDATDLVPPDATALVPDETGALGFDGLPNSENDGLGLGAGTGAGAGAGATFGIGALNPNMGFFTGAGLGAGAGAGALGVTFGLLLPNPNEKAGALFLGATG